MTDKDVQKIIEANKAVFYDKQEMDSKFNDLRGDFNKLQSSVDRLAGNIADYVQEMKMLGSKIDRHEKWIQQLAQKLGVSLDY